MPQASPHDLAAHVLKPEYTAFNGFQLSITLLAGVGVPVKADASFSVSRALQLQLPKQLEILEEVSEYASREYSLERALDKMQVGHCLQMVFYVYKPHRICHLSQSQRTSCILQVVNTLRQSYRIG